MVNPIRFEDWVFYMAAGREDIPWAILAERKRKGPWRI
jgi:hypothetical protein